MKSKELNLLFLKRFPNLRKAFEDETEWQEGIDTGSTVVFEDVFMPYIIFCVENNLEDEISNCFKFVEECVSSNDDYQKQVIEISIIDNIRSYDISEKLISYLLPKSLASFNS